MGNGIPDIEIWRTMLTDAETAFALVAEYYGAAGVMKREHRREFVEEYFGEGRGFWLARVTGELAGCVGLRKLRCPEQPVAERHACAEIKRMYVRKKFRGRGLAPRLLLAAEQFARDEGYLWIYLDTTTEMVAAARLYQRNGYQLCARYNENPQATIFMRKSLHNASKRAR